MLIQLTSYKLRSAIGVLLILSVLSACSRLKKPTIVPPILVPAEVAPPVPLPYEAPADLSAKDRMVRIIKLLEAGNADHARIDLRAYLFHNPNSKLGQSLMEQISRTPEAILGTENYEYEVQSNESLSQLAERFLGDRYKFWILARYNGITNPIKLTQGKRLKIPGLPKPSAVLSKPLPGDDEEIGRRLEEEQAEKKEPPKVDAPKPVSIIDPIRAMALRKIGLENLQRGKIDTAISFFKQAIEFASGTPSLSVIQKDLARAMRLQASVKK
jgi:tetratricopeptide (TPR) repeat protein